MTLACGSPSPNRLDMEEKSRSSIHRRPTRMRVVGAVTVKLDNGLAATERLFERSGSTNSVGQVTRSGVRVEHAE